MSSEGKDGSSVKRYSRPWWLAKLRAEGKAHDVFRKQARRAYEDYRGTEKVSDSGDNGQSDQTNFYPLFWSNTQVVHGALYARQPKPDVRKRYKDANVSKNLAQAIERELTFTLDTEDMDDHAHRCVDDYLVAGVGAAKVEYIPVVDDVPEKNELGEPVYDTDEWGEPKIGDDGQPLVRTTPEIVAQSMRLEYIPWDRFRWEPVKDWEDCTWAGIIHYLSRQEVRQRFGVTIDDTDESGSDNRIPGRFGPPKDQLKYQGLIAVAEIWCKATRKLHWIGLDTEKIDKEQDDPLNLVGFYPFPRPMMLNVKDGELIPKPDYTFIGPTCRYVDLLTKRIFSLTNLIKDVMAHDGSMPELAQMNDPRVPDGTTVAVQGLQVKLAMAPGGKLSLDSVVLQKDNSTKVAVVQQLMQLREAAIQKVDQLTGISDIVRGQSDASETATAQQLKGQWANIRLLRKKEAVNGFFREIFRIMSEIIAEHYTPQQIALTTGIELTPEEMATLKSDVGRTFAIDVETDSTIATDEAEEKAKTLELGRTFNEFFNGTSNMPPDLQKAVLSMVVRPYKNATELTEAIDALPSTQQQMQQLQQQVQQLTQQLQQTQGELAKVDQAKNAREDLKAQADAVGKAGEAEKDKTTGVLNLARADEANAGALERVANVVKPPEPKIVTMRPPGRPA